MFFDSCNDNHKLQKSILHDDLRQLKCVHLSGRQWYCLDKNITTGQCTAILPCLMPVAARYGFSPGAGSCRRSV